MPRQARVRQPHLTAPRGSPRLEFQMGRRPWYDRRTVEGLAIELAAGLDGLDAARAGVTDRDHETLARMAALARRAATDRHYFEHDGYISQFVAEIRAAWRALHRREAGRQGALALRIGTPELRATADRVDAIVRELARHIWQQRLAVAREEHESRHAPLSRPLADALARLVRESEYTRAVQVLETCSDSERVRTAVLLLAAQAANGAEGLDDLEELAVAAVEDWRDVLLWAEYSPESVDYAAELARLGLPHPAG